MTSAEWKPQVYLVGAGPGDPGLLTRRGEAILRRAEVVLYDSLIDPALLELAPEGAEKIAVGKRAGGVGPRQPWINEKLIAEARAGRTVVRLKGGDPFVFGRGGEEALALVEAGVRFEVVPGVSSASAVPAAAGIPVSHRGASSVVHIVTGHEDPGDAGPEARVRWDLFTRAGHTVVVLMGSAHLVEILQRLAEAGIDPATPVAVIRWGTTPKQQSLRTTVGAALAAPESVRLASPALAVIGAVAGLPEALNWFERRPLFGRRYVLTRPSESGGDYDEALREAGAEVVSVPVVEISSGPAESVALLSERLDAVRGGSGWLVLPSPNAIERFFGALAELGRDARSLAGIRVAVVGERSAAQLLSRGVRADCVASGETGASLAAELDLSLPAEAQGKFAPKILIAGSRDSRAELRAALRERGAEVTHHVLYATLPNEAALKRLAELEAETIDGLLVFSPSAVDAIVSGIDDAEFAQLRRCGWFAIGPTTAEALRAQGIEPAGVAARPTPDALVECLAQVPAH